VSTHLGSSLPPELVDYFSGDDLEAKVNQACVLVTLGADGFPHPCLVTAGELVAVGPDLLRVALYTESSATRNLRERGVGTLCHVNRGAAYYVKVEASPVAVTDEALRGLAVFTLIPRQVLRDAEEGTRVTSGFRFADSAGPRARVAAWRAIVAALRTSFLPPE
jgi:hypothetical protein